MKAPAEIFRAYDIRGLVDTQLTDELAYHLGRAYGTYLKRHKAKACSVGCDARLTGPSYAKRLSQGLVDSGIDVVEIGLVSTPMTYYTVWTQMVDASVMVTASHNPPEYNGYKMTHDGEKLSSTGYQELLALIEEEDYEEGHGNRERRSIDDEYVRACLERLENGRKLAIVVDTGNGTGGTVLPRMLKEMGHNVIELYTEPDGTFPNHHPDPSEQSSLEDLQRAIADHGADLGIALDGDADRVAVVDELSHAHFTDELIALFARELLADSERKNVVFDVKCSKLVKDTVEDAGGNPIEGKTGNPFISALIDEHDALFGGEMSGHLFFNDRYYGYDDGIYSGCRVAELLSLHDGTMSELFPDNPYLSTPEVKVHVSEEHKFAIIDEVTEAVRAEGLDPLTIDGVKIYDETGWTLIRASNTSNYLSIRCEASTEEALDSKKARVLELLNPILESKGEKPVRF